MVLAEQRSAREASLRAASRTLGEMLDRDEEAIALLGGDALPGSSAYLDICRSAWSAGGASELRLEKRRRFLQIAAFDLAGDLQLEQVGRALADLADACLQTALEALDAPDLCVIAMGKLGARELNYVSDIDIMFVTHDDPGRSTATAEQLLEILGGHSPQGRAFEIDTALRPEGRAGALVRSLDGCLEYYKRWAKEWEYQALLKARPCAGSLSAGCELVEATRPLVFAEEVTSERIAAIRRMKQLVEEHAARGVSLPRSPSRTAERARRGVEDVKLGPGGIRDVEFSVQLLQLVHGGGDPSVRSPATLDALSALVEGGYVAEEDGAGLAVAYRWLRTVEHRLQLRQERRVRTLPSTEEESAQFARIMGFRDSPLESAAARFAQVHASVLADVRSRFEKLFYRPMIESLAGEPRLGAEPLRDRLRILGFRDVERAARTLEGLVSGTSRRAKLFRVLTPALLRHLSHSPRPDDGLFGFLKLGEALADRLDALGALRDNPPGIEFLARVLGSGRFLGEILEHVPEELTTIADSRGPQAPKKRERLVHEAAASLGWRDPEERLDGLRRFKRREMLRVALYDLAGGSEIERVGAGLADLADACLEAAGPDDVQFAVIGMGKLGGRELNYSSDIDVMFVHADDPQRAERLAEELMQAIGAVTPEGQTFRIDAALRPEGRSGPLVRSLASFAEYYERWGQPWEYLALGKARHAAGDPELGQSFVELAHRFAFPERFAAASMEEIRHLKARMERERIPRGADPRLHYKLGPGGLSDIEFAVQAIQVANAGKHEGLRTTATLDALDAARRLGLMGDPEAEVLADAYRFLMRLRNRAFLAAGRPVDALPAKPEDLEALAVAMGFSEQPRQELEEAYLRTTRRVRRVAEPLIYGSASVRDR